MTRVRSLEWSSTARHSQSARVWARSDSMQSPSVASPSRTGSRIETLGGAVREDPRLWISSSSGGTPGQKTGHLLQQLLLREGFGHEDIGAALQRLRLIERMASRGQQEEGNGRSMLVA